MSNNRVFYAIQAVGFKEDGVEGDIPSGQEVHGGQTVSIDTNFNLEDVFELGQLDSYELYENKPEISMTVEKALDGTPLVYHLATKGSSGPALNTRVLQKTIAVLGIWPDAYSSASGDPSKFVTCSGLYVDSLNYNLAIDGNFTESVTLVGSNKIWDTGSSFAYEFDNTDEPTDGVQRRENVVMGEAATYSEFPTEIPGITSSGTNPLNSAGTAYTAHIQNIAFSCDLGQTDLNEQGRKGEYCKYPTYPIDVTTTIDYIATENGDSIDAQAEADNISDQTIRVLLDDNTQFYTGTKNKLQTVSYSGGDTGGGNVTVSLSYVAKNILTITNPDTDPDAHAHP